MRKKIAQGLQDHHDSQGNLIVNKDRLKLIDEVRESKIGHTMQT